VGYPKYGKIPNQKITRLSPPWASHRPLVAAVVTPKERKKQNHKSFMEESRSFIQVRKERRIPALENLISGFFIVRQLTP